MSSRQPPLAHRLIPWLLPGAVATVAIVGWEFTVQLARVPPYVLPAPSEILRAFLADWRGLLRATGVTLRVTLEAFVLALASGIGLGIAFARSRLVELALAPYAVALQVTPVVAIAPLIVIWVGADRPQTAMVILAWIVAFFPVLSSTTLGIRSTDPHLRDLFRLQGANGWQRLIRLEMPSALPALLGGIKVSAGLALIGAVVAEFVAGSGASTGLAWLIIESTNRLETPRAFAALTLLAGLGILLFFSLTMLEHRLLRRWHQSARPLEH